MYFLIEDDSVVTYSDSFDVVRDALVDTYGGRLSISEWGIVSRDELLGYTDIHEGCYRFIDDTVLVDSDINSARDVYICILQDYYLYNYLDDFTDCGYAVLNWLKGNAHNFRLDYSATGFERYCVVMDGKIKGSSSSLDEAFYSLKDIVSNTSNEDRSSILSYGLQDLKNFQGYYTFENISNGNLNIGVVDLDSILRCLHMPDIKYVFCDLLRCGLRLERV